MDTIQELVILTICFLALFLLVYKNSAEIKYGHIIKRINIVALIIFILAFITPVHLLATIALSYIIIITLYIISKFLQKKKGIGDSSL